MGHRDIAVSRSGFGPTTAHLRLEPRMGQFAIPLVSRRSVVLAALAAPTALHAQPAPCARQRILFVCPAGTVKSAIAREMLKARAAAVSFPVVAESRGLVVEDHVSPGLAANLRADGIDPAADPARVLTEADVDKADIVIAFDEASQAPTLQKARAWDIPSWNSDYAAAKSALTVRVDDLLAELKAREGRGCGGSAR